MSFDDISITRSKRHSISIQILAGGKVVVKAPQYVPEFLVRRFLLQRKEWIEKQIQKQQRIAPSQEHTYKEGETYMFLGLSYTLKFAEVTDISLQQNELLFPRSLVFRIQKELHAWYVKQAKTIISSCVQDNAEKMKVSFTSLRFSDTSSKWGSCSWDNRLQFNWRLIMAPMVVVNYVVIHELAHTIEKNHGQAFWKIVAVNSPSYKQHRKWLHSQGNSLVV